MKKLLPLLKDYKKETILGPLFKLLEAAFELLIPLVMKSIIDVGIKNEDTTFIITRCLLMISLGVIGLICSVTAQYFAAKAAVGFSTKLRHKLFSHIQSLSFSEIDKLGTATLITRMTSDINQVQNGVNLVLRLFLRSPFIVFGAMIMAFTINVKAALIFAVTIPLLSIVVFGVMLASIPLFKKVQKGLDKILGITRENLTGVRVIRAFNKEQDELEAFSEGNEALMKIQVFAGKVTAVMNPLTYVIINTATVILINSGAVKVDAGILTRGDVIALVNYMSQILVELVKLANLIISVTKAAACGNRIESVLDTAPSINEDSNSDVKPVFNSEYAVEFENVEMRYNVTGEPALSGISFKVKKGETVGIIGGTGSGKSSLVHLIPRFYDASSGSVKVAGKDVKEYGAHNLRDCVGIVMQKAMLFKGTIKDNLLWGKGDAAEDELINAVEVAQALEFVEKKEDGLNSIVGQEGKNFSGGQKQRLSIARAIVKHPDILILDDSASALDFATDAKLRQAIKNIGGDVTVFIVSQRTSSIQHADKIIVLDEGRMAGIGTHDELLKNCDVYKEIYNSQFKGNNQ